MRLTGKRVAAAATALFVTSTVVLTVSSPVELVRAASITVNTATDIAPNGSGVYPTDGKCSLRAAIAAAQFNSNAHDVDCSTGAPVPNVLDIIQIDPSLAGQTLTLTYNNGSGVQPFERITGMTNPLEIIGPNLSSGGFTIDAANAVRPFVVGYGTLEAGSLQLANLTVKRGNGNDNGANSDTIDGDGGAISLQALDNGVDLQGSHLTLDNVVLRDNNVGGSARGGAVYGVASVITNNGGAYIANHANGVGTSGAGGGRGGAVFINQGPATFNGYAMLMQDNTATWAGGAIATNPANGTPLVHIERSLLQTNSVPAGKGGGGVLAIDTGTGGGTTVFQLYDSTITGNASVFTALSNTQLYDYRRDTFVDTGAVMSAGGGLMVNSIVKGASSCTDTGGPQSHNGSRNLLESCTILSGSDIGDVTNLGPLAQNGGPEVQQTYALLGGSNAIDNGDVAYCGTIDARSVARGLDGDGSANSPQTGDCDIGAYEYARFVVNFVTGTSSVNENAGTGSVGVKLKILNAADNPLPAPLVVNVGLGAGSTARIGPSLTHDDLDITAGSITFPAGSVDGAIVNVPANIHQDNIAELFGEVAVLNLTGSPTPGVAVAEPKAHNLTIQDDDQAGVVVTQTGGTTALSESTPLVGDSVTVALQSQPDYQLLNPALPLDPASYGPPADVDMTITPDRDCTISDGVSTGTSASPLHSTILNANWQSGKTLTLVAVNDLYDEDLRNEAAPHTCEIRFTFTSLDPIYAATQDAFDASVTDNDVAGVTATLVGAPAVIGEGSAATASYQVVLDTPPDPGKPLPGVPRGPTSVVFTASAGCSVNGGPTASLPFTSANFNVAQTVALAPVDNLLVELARNCSATSSIVSQDPVYADLDDLPAFAHTPPTLTASVQDYDPPTITDDPPFVDVTTGGSVSVVEGGATDTVSVVLRRQPQSNVTVTLTAPNDAIIGSVQALVAGSPSTPLTFTNANWNVPQIVTVSAFNDDYDEAATHPTTVGVTIASAAPGFSSASLRKVVIDGVESADSGAFDVTVGDNDTSALVFNGGLLVITTVTEGGAGDTLLVRLATHPYHDVTLTLTTDGQCLVGGSTSTDVSFVAAGGAWAIDVPVAVTAVDDPVVEAPQHSCVIDTAVASTDSLYDVLGASRTATVNDNEVAEVRITAGAPLTLPEGGAGDTFDVVLAGQPSADVTVSFAAAGVQTTNSGPVTFTPANWATPQTVTVTAVDDLIDEVSPHAGNTTATITTTALGFSTSRVVVVDGAPTPTITGNVIDDDVAGLTVAGAPFVAAENGGTDTFTVVLTSQPTADVTVAATPTGLCSVSAAHTFTAANWSTPQTFTVTGGNDDIVHAQPCSIDLAASGTDGFYDGLTSGATGTITDDDTTGLVVSATGVLHLAEYDVATTVSYDVELASEPLSDVTVTITPTAGQLTTDAPTLTFTPLNWDVAQAVTVTVVDDTTMEATPHSATVANTATAGDPAYLGASATVDVDIRDNDTATSLVAAPSPSNNGVSTVLTATVTGGDGTPTGTVTFRLDGNPVGSPVALVGGVATLDLGPLARATHGIQADYSGDSHHAVSSDSGSVVVTAVPVAAADSATVAEDSGATVIDVLANDTDADTDPLAISGHSTPAHGTVTCTAANCSYAPAPNYNGSDSFTYTVSDGALTATATVTVTVLPINDPPTIGTIALNVVSGSTVTFELLAGATDVDGDPLVVQSTTQPAHGLLSCTASGHCTYTPTVGYVGPDSFTFVISDGKLVPTGLSAEAVTTGTVTIDVTAVPPTSTTTPPSTGFTPGSGTTGGGSGSGGRPLPATGSDTGSTLVPAAWLVLVGVLALGATRVRRRATSSASGRSPSRP